MTINETTTVKTYHSNRPSFGRTTTLVHKTTGDKLIEVMGACSRKECWDAFIRKYTKHTQEA